MSKPKSADGGGGERAFARVAIAAAVGGVSGGLVAAAVLVLGGSANNDIEDEMDEIMRAVRNQSLMLQELHNEMDFERQNQTDQQSDGRGDDDRQGNVESDYDDPPRSTARFGGYDELVSYLSRRERARLHRGISEDALLAVFGPPALQVDNQRCASVTSERLQANIILHDFGPFEARLLRPAVTSMERVMDDVEKHIPDLFEHLTSHGGLCVRQIRNSETRLSRHAFGVAIDLSVGDQLDRPGDNLTQTGLLRIADYFEREGWVWGISFPTEDSMHFEVGRDLFESWIQEGLIVDP